MSCYLDTLETKDCFGCEACVQVCAKGAIQMQEDHSGFRYPILNKDICVDCGLCRKVCPMTNMPERHLEDKLAFGGYHLNEQTRFESTSGGAFSAIAEAFCDENYVIFGAEAKGLEVLHSYVTDIKDLNRFRKSKYSQSVIGQSYKQAKQFLAEGKKVLFSGTPCQIAGLMKVLGGNTNQQNLLTVEVVCEGVPSPLYIRKFDKYIESRYGSPIKDIDYRYTGKSILGNGKWDFEAMKLKLKNGVVLSKDRWLNPFWKLWLGHLMTRPSCYECPFATQSRVADITLGDLWGVHLYCPELYGKNGGSSLIVCNTEQGKTVLKLAQQYLFGHELDFETALKYQSPMRKHISDSPDRPAFMADLESDLTYTEINRKWAKQPSLKLLWQKYVWGNRQKIFLWNLKHRIN